jgi:rubrerythrin
VIIHTTSEGITLAKKLENDSAAFYESVAQKYPQDAETFLAFAKENKRNIQQTERVYFGVITDAIEGSYAFNLEIDNYSVDTRLKAGAKYAGILQQAIQLEEKIIKFYSDAAEQSRPLMADIPRAFDIIARKRRARLEKLASLS